MKRLTISVLGRWTCNDGRGWIARRRSASHVIVKAVVVSMANHISPVYDDPFFTVPRVYGSDPCPPVATVLAEAMGYDVPYWTNQRDYDRGARRYIKANIEQIPFED